MIHRVLSNDPFARVRKAVLDDKRLTWKAKGVFAYLMGKPDDWRGIVADIVNHGPDGATAIRAAIKELVKYGYAKEERIREAGKLAGLVIHVSDDPTFFSKEPEKKQSKRAPRPRSENLNEGKLDEGKANEENLREGNPSLNKNEKTNEKDQKVTAHAEPDGNAHKTFVTLYTEAFQVRFERPYFFQGAKDGASTKRLLEGSKKSPAELIEIVKKAWERMHLFGCKRSNTITGFMSAYNEICHEIETGQPSANLPPLGAGTAGGRLQYVKGQRPPQSNGWNRERFKKQIGAHTESAPAA